MKRILAAMVSPEMRPSDGKMSGYILSFIKIPCFQGVDVSLHFTVDFLLARRPWELCESLIRKLVRSKRKVQFELPRSSRLLRLSVFAWFRLRSRPSLSVMCNNLAPMSSKIPFGLSRRTIFLYQRFSIRIEVLAKSSVLCTSFELMKVDSKDRSSPIAQYTKTKIARV